MYETFFGLRERPFDLAPNPRYLFLSDRQREALSTIQYALQGPRGLMLMIGEAGTGKTTLVQAALAEMGTAAAQCVLLSNPTLTREEFYEYLARAFELPGEAGQSKARFLFEFRRHVEQRQTNGCLTAILFDEAQSLPYELLEEIRLLSNMETPTTKFLSVVLVGQPELAARLNEPQLRQLKQRIALRCELSVFDLADTAAYMAGRLRIAGGAPVEIFTRNAVDAIFKGSGGVPRVINVICHNALIGGFATQTKPITQTLIEEVLRDFDFHSGRLDVSPREQTDSTSREQAEDSVPTLPDQKTERSQDEHQPAKLSFRMFGRKRGFSFF
jgi:general secretion pathway protein A